MRRNIFEKACLEEQHRREYEKECSHSFSYKGADPDYLSPGKKAILLLVVSILIIFGVLWGMDKISKAEADFQKMREDTIKEMQDMNYRINTNRVKTNDIHESELSNGGQYNEKE